MERTSIIGDIQGRRIIGQYFKSSRLFHPGELLKQPRNKGNKDHRTIFQEFMVVSSSRTARTTEQLREQGSKKNISGVWGSSTLLNRLK